MKHPCLTASCLACALLGGAPWVGAESGHIVFAGAIVEPGCPLGKEFLDCVPGRRAEAIVRPLDMASARSRIHAELFAYALQRDRSAIWEVVDITYR